MQHISLQSTSVATQRCIKTTYLKTLLKYNLTVAENALTARVKSADKIDEMNLKDSYKCYLCCVFNTILRRHALQIERDKVELAL